MKHMKRAWSFLFLSIVHIICFSSSCDSSDQLRISCLRAVQEPINLYQNLACAPVNSEFIFQANNKMRDQSGLYTVNLQCCENNFGVHMTQSQAVRDGIAMYARLTYEQEMRERIRQAEIMEAQQYARLQFAGELCELRQSEIEYCTLYKLCKIRTLLIIIKNAASYLDCFAAMFPAIVQ